jgi:hypothetical protein
MFRKDADIATAPIGVKVKYDMQNILSRETSMRHFETQISSAPSRRSKAVFAGSLRGDLAEVARTVHLASLHFDVTVWANANAEVLFDRSERSPDVAPEYLAGTYGIGALPSDIESDLRVLRSERVSSAILS